MDGTKFCQYCGTPVRSARGQNPQGAAPRQQSAAPGANQVSGQPDMGSQKKTSVQSGPAHIRPATRTPVQDAAPEKKKKSPIGLIIVAAVAVVAVIFGVSHFKEKPPETFRPVDVMIPDEDVYVDNSNRETITVDASNPGETLAPSNDSYADTSDAIEDFAKRLAQSGDTEAANAVYSMVPKAELAQAARDQTEKLEESSNGPVQVYNMYQDVKQMFTSIYGEEGGR
jgi:hypothetical protein